ncbi:MAG: hypothetical protein AAF533_07995 [Acidobacteriota bacterium]
MRELRRIVTVGLSLAIGVTVVSHSRVASIESEDVPLQADGAILAATVSRPRFGDGPWPALVVVPGSGSQPRHSVPGVVSELVPGGVVALTYDKRGTRRSTGGYPSPAVEISEESLGVLAEDALVAWRYLSRRDDVDPERIGFVGGGHASWVMSLAADRESRVACFVALSGPAVTVGEERLYSSLTGDGALSRPLLSDDEISRRLSAFEGPHGHDPRRTLWSLRCPSLWLLGGLDQSQPAVLTRERLEWARSAGLELDVEWFPRADHRLRDRLTDERLDYWPVITGWLDRQGMTGERRDLR